MIELAQILGARRPVGEVRGRPTLAHPISQACTQSQFEEPEYAAWCAEIRETPRYHRKQWEFCYILQALQSAGMIRDGARGLGFGVGAEPLTALFAQRGCSILATDLDLADAKQRGWVDTNQHASHLEALNERGICDPDAFRSRVAFKFLDMNAIPTDLTGFDFCWSACAFEHLGSIEQGLDFVVNSLRTLQSGGVAIHTTELNCSSDWTTLSSGATVLFRKRDMRRLAVRLEELGVKVAITFDLGDGPLDRYVDAPPYTQDKHLKLQLARYVTTSFGIIAQKP